MITPRRLIALIVLAAIALALAGAVATTARAETAAEIQQKLQDARSRIDAAKKQKASLSDQIAGLDGKLAAIQDRLDGLGDQIASVEDKLSVTREKLDVLREELRLKRLELEKAQARLELEQENFQERVVLSYKSDDLDYIDVMLASSSFEDLISRVNVIHDLLGGDNDLVGGLEDTRDEVDAEKDAIAKREGAVADAAHVLQEKSDELAALRAAQAASQAAALAVRKQKSGALAGVNQDLAELERQENQLLAESAAITGVITGSTGSGSRQRQPELAGERAGHVALRLAHPPDPRLQEVPHRHRHRRGLRHADPRRRRRHRHLRHVDGRLRQRDHRRPRRRPLHAVRAPVQPRRRQRRAREPRPDRRATWARRGSAPARTCTSRCGSTATPSTRWATCLTPAGPRLPPPPRDRLPSTD